MRALSCNARNCEEWRDRCRLPPCSHRPGCRVGFHMLRSSPSQGPGSLVVPEPRPQHSPTLSDTCCEINWAIQPSIEPEPVAYTIRSAGNSLPSLKSTECFLISL